MDGSADRSVGTTILFRTRLAFTTTRRGPNPRKTTVSQWPLRNRLEFWKKKKIMKFQNVVFLAAFVVIASALSAVSEKIRRCDEINPFSFSSLPECLALCVKSYEYCYPYKYHMYRSKDPIFCYECHRRQFPYHYVDYSEEDWLSCERCLSVFCPPNPVSLASVSLISPHKRLRNGKVTWDLLEIVIVPLLYCFSDRTLNRLNFKSTLFEILSNVNQSCKQYDNIVHNVVVALRYERPDSNVNNVCCYNIIYRMTRGDFPISVSILTGKSGNYDGTSCISMFLNRGYARKYLEGSRVKKS